VSKPNGRRPAQLTQGPAAQLTTTRRSVWSCDHTAARQLFTVRFPADVEPATHKVLQPEDLLKFERQQLRPQVGSARAEGDGERDGRGGRGDAARQPVVVTHKRARGARAGGSATAAGRASAVPSAPRHSLPPAKRQRRRTLPAKQRYKGANKRVHSAAGGGGSDEIEEVSFSTSEAEDENESCESQESSSSSDEDEENGGQRPGTPASAAAAAAVQAREARDAALARQLHR
jgi:hypothetical protein